MDMPRYQFVVLGRYPSLLDREHMQIVNDHGKQRIRQLPGPKNALGLVKFMFPNDFNIYLHDTPNGELFKKDVRAFSHGCIRVEKPGEIESALDQAFSANRPCVVEVMTDQEAVAPVAYVGGGS